MHSERHLTTAEHQAKEEVGVGDTAEDGTVGPGGPEPRCLDVFGLYDRDWAGRGEKARRLRACVVGVLSAGRCSPHFPMRAVRSGVRLYGGREAEGGLPARRESRVPWTGRGHLAVSAPRRAHGAGLLSGARVLAPTEEWSKGQSTAHSPPDLLHEARRSMRKLIARWTRVSPSAGANSRRQCSIARFHLEPPI